MIWKAIVNSAAALGIAWGLSLTVSVAIPTAPAQAAMNCGGLNQKTCISINPAKRCKSGLVEQRQSGRNICVRPSQVQPKPDASEKCGGLGQKTCISVNPAKRCNSGLVEQRRAGRNICLRPAQVQPQCGGLNQKTCVSLDPAKRCKAGLAEQRQSGRNICVPASQVERNCGGLNQETCININPAKRCETGLTEQRLYGRNICVRPEDVVEKDDTCGGLGQVSCISVNPLKWCDTGLVQKRQPGRNICIEKVTNADRLDVARTVIDDLGEDNPLARLSQCLGQPSKIGRLRTAMTDRSRFAISSLLTECNASISELANMGTISAINDGNASVSTRGASGNPDGFFKTLHITAGGSGAAWVAGTASAGYVIELVSNPNGRWYFTGGLGTGPKAEVVGDVTVALSRSDIPTGGVGFDHGTSAVVSGHYGVGLSGGVAFVGNTLDFDGVSFGVGGGLGAGGAVYKNGSVFPFPDL